MNERIAELWNKAAKSTKDDSWSSQVTFVEKFAELIVRECAKVFWNIDDGELHEEYVRELKKHFGMKE